jgi:hypothetical protein
MSKEENKTLIRRLFEEESAKLWGAELPRV